MILVCDVVMVSLNLEGAERLLRPINPLLTCESLALIAFGIAWLTKGNGIPSRQAAQPRAACLTARTTHSSPILSGLYRYGSDPLKLGPGELNLAAKGHAGIAREIPARRDREGVHHQVLAALLGFVVEAGIGGGEGEIAFGRKNQRHA